MFLTALPSDEHVDCAFVGKARAAAVDRIMAGSPLPKTVSFMMRRNPMARRNRITKVFSGPGKEVGLSHCDLRSAATVATSDNPLLRKSGSSARWSGAKLIEGIGIVAPPCIEQFDRLNETHAQPCQAVFDSRWNIALDMTADQADLFHIA